jgi:hypothetical protein
MTAIPTDSTDAASVCHWRAGKWNTGNVPAGIN